MDVRKVLCLPTRTFDLWLNRGGFRVTRYYSSTKEPPAREDDRGNMKQSRREIIIEYLADTPDHTEPLHYSAQYLRLFDTSTLHVPTVLYSYICIFFYFSFFTQGTCYSHPRLIFSASEFCGVCARWSVKFQED